jgi:5-methylcytosine-specific restriction endonuclease McrA
MSPWAAPHPCAQPYCGALVPSGTSRCPAHLTALRKAQDARRPSPSRRGYGASWTKLRVMVLERDGERCAIAGCEVRATEVDHRLPKHQGEPMPRRTFKRCARTTTARRPGGSAGVSRGGTGYDRRDPPPALRGTPRERRMAFVPSWPSKDHG